VNIQQYLLHYWAGARYYTIYQTLQYQAGSVLYYRLIVLHYRALIILSGILYNITGPVLHYQSIIGCKILLLFCRTGCL